MRIAFSHALNGTAHMLKQFEQAALQSKLASMHCFAKVRKLIYLCTPSRRRLYRCAMQWLVRQISLTQVETTDSWQKQSALCRGAVFTCAHLEHEWFGAGECTNLSVTLACAVLIVYSILTARQPAMIKFFCFRKAFHHNKKNKKNIDTVDSSPMLKASSTVRLARERLDLNPPRPWQVSFFPHEFAKKF